MKQKLFSILTLLLCAVSGASATDYTWTFDTYCSNQSIAVGSNASIATGGVVVSTSNDVNLTYIEGKAESSRMYNLSSAEGPTGDVNYSSYLYMGGEGKTSTTNRCFTTGTITGKGQLTIIYKTGTGSFSVYDASSTSTPLATVSDLANSSAKSTIPLDLGTGKQLIIAHSGKCYIYAIKWTAASATALSVTYSISPAAGGTVNQTPSGSSFEPGAAIEFTATPNTGYKFVNWTDDNNGDEELGTSTTYNIASISEATAITANFAALNAITFSANGGTGDVPASSYVDDGESYTVPTWLHLYKEGFTFAGWKNGETTYTAGQTFESISDDIALEAQWITNTQVLGNAATTASWKFGSDDNAPTISIQGSNQTKYYVTKATVNGSSIDVPLYIDANNGKFNTQAAYAQVNGGTKFTLPAVTGMTVTYTSGANSHTDVTLFAFDDSENVEAEMYSNNLVFTYNGTNSTITFTDNDGTMWPTGISVSYPKYVSEPASAEDNSVILTYTNGSVSDKTWTGSDNCLGYTITTNEAGSIGQKNNEKFAFGYGGTYTITVPEGMTVTSFKISGQANSSTSYVTYNETQKSFGNSSVADQNWTIANPTAGGSIIFSVETKQLNVTSITLYTSDITLTTTDNMAGWRAFYDAEKSYTVDENTKIYTVTSQDEKSVKLTEVTGRIPTQTPVLLKTSDANHTMTLTAATTGDEINISGNLLQATNGSTVSNVYRLGYGANGVGFYQYSATSPASGIVYLPANTGGAKALLLSFGDVTAIDAVAADETVNTGNGKMYNLSGQLVGEGYKGIVIVNGKKIVK